jgi:putative ABC transport system permease protein
MHRWLNIFAYHTDLSFLPFVISAMVLAFTTILTVSFHTAKAAMANPASKLRAD